MSYFGGPKHRYRTINLLELLEEKRFENDSFIHDDDDRGLVLQLAGQERADGTFRGKYLDMAKKAVHESPWMVNEDSLVELAQKEAIKRGFLKQSELKQWPFDSLDWDSAADDLTKGWQEIEYQGDVWLWRAP